VQSFLAQEAAMIAAVQTQKNYLWIVSGNINSFISETLHV